MDSYTSRLANQIHTAAEWVDERTGWRAVWETIFLRNIPKIGWSYTLGSATLFVALTQMITGILLTIYYVPTPDHAYDTVQYITYEVAGGWFVRGIHHYGASAMIVLAVLHLLRVIINGSYKFPREITWISGVILFLLALGFGFTGYLLPWDQRAYWATQVGTEIAATPPIIGDWILRVMRGGSELSEVTLARFFGVHVWVLPLLLLIFIGIHMYLVVKHGISAPPEREDASDG